MKIHLHASIFFESWSWKNAETGIGGSETHQIEYAWRLARRGYEVTSYAPLPEDSPSEHLGVQWRMWDKADFNEEGLWVIYRGPEMLDNFTGKKFGQRIWFMAQDEHYGMRLTKDRADKVEKFLVLSPWHAVIFGSIYPFIPKEKLVLTSNGIKVDLIRELERGEVPARNPNKAIFTSSPDRGMETAIAILRRAREWNPDLELHCYYGLDNIEKLIALSPKYAHYKGMRERILRAAEAPGIVFHGRISQRELYKEIMSAGIWLYPTEFGETSCINCMEAQAMGAVPLFNPYAALGTNVYHGVAITGWPYRDQLIQCRYVGELVSLSKNVELQEKIRGEMMSEARSRFNWERWVDQWCNWIERIDHKFHTQFQFQARYMRGRTLNVGCGDDPMQFARVGVTNMDISEVGPVAGVINRPHIIHDAREPFPVKNWDSIVIGDLLEHMSEEDAVKVLKNAKAALANGGPVIITCPNDEGRPHQKQHKDSTGDEMYAEGVSAFHDRAITEDDLRRIVEQAGLQVELSQVIDYSDFAGTGIVCR